MLGIANQYCALGLENLGWWFPHISRQAENVNNLLYILFATQAEYHNPLPLHSEETKILGVIKRTAERPSFMY